MRNILKLTLVLTIGLTQVTSALAQVTAETDSAGKRVDNNLTFGVISEKIRSRGMMKVCITDTSGQCIRNLQSGFVIKVFNAQGKELWAGKTAGRSQLLEFPEPMREAAWIELIAFKPYVLNTYTGTRIHQDKPIEIKYVLEDE